MLDSLLEVGKRYLYKGKYLTYQRFIPRPTPKHFFCSEKGDCWELSLEVVRRDVWAPIDITKLEAFNE
jgi:hypothetical protein